VPPPPEPSIDEKKIQQSYIQDATKTAFAEQTKSRVEFVRRMMEKNDIRWSKVQEKVAKMEDRRDQLLKAHDRESQKFLKMDEEYHQKARQNLPISFTQEEWENQAEKTNKALSKFFDYRKRMTDSAWKEIKKHVGSEDTSFETGSAPIKKVELKAGYPHNIELNDNQKQAVDAAEKRLSGAVSNSLRQRVEETEIESIGEDQRQRAYFAGARHGKGGSFIYLPRSTDEQTVAHEFGHSLETNAGIHAAAQGFLYHRVNGEGCKPMSESKLAGNFDSWEVGRDDEFSKAFGDSARYVGKHYKTNDTEIVSMGLEHMVSNPVNFARKDPEYFKFMLGVLDGTFS
jgi:hypothetical protein